MRIRTIKPEFWRSADVAALSREHRLLFAGLWSYCDDNGVGVDDHRVVAAELFALDDDPLEAREFVREGLARLSAAGLIVRDTVAGRPLLYVPTWDRHQRVDKPNKQRYDRPDPAAMTLTSVDSSDRETLARPSRDSREGLAPGTGEQGNRGTGESTPSSTAAAAPADRATTRPPTTPRLVAKPPTPATAGSDVDEWFDRFWAAYPRKIDKRKASQAFRSVLRRKVPPERLVTAAQAYARQCDGREARYVKHPTSWLNADSWENAPEPARLTAVPDVIATRPEDPVARVAWMREHGAGDMAAGLIGRPWLPATQPLADPRSRYEWDVEQARMWIDAHHDELVAAAARRRTG